MKINSIKNVRRFSLAPGFSPVSAEHARSSRFNGFINEAGKKRLKPFLRLGLCFHPAEAVTMQSHRGIARVSRALVGVPPTSRVRRQTPSSVKVPAATEVIGGTPMTATATVALPFSTASLRLKPGANEIKFPLARK